MVVSFYKNFLTKWGEEDQNATQELLENIPSLISKDDNRRLLAPLSDKEITTTIFVMDKDKAPNLDCFPTWLFHHFWNIIGDDIIKAVQEFHKHNTQKLEHHVSNFHPKGLRSK